MASTLATFVLLGLLLCCIKQLGTIFQTVSRENILSVCLARLQTTTRRDETLIRGRWDSPVWSVWVQFSTHAKHIFSYTHQNLLSFCVISTSRLDACDLSNPARTCTRILTSVQPASLPLFLCLHLTLLHPIHLSFAISICSNDIYLASWECPSAISHNKSYKYQPSSRGSCNIYGGNVAVGRDVDDVYGEHRAPLQNETGHANFSSRAILGQSRGSDPCYTQITACRPVAPMSTFFHVHSSHARAANLHCLIVFGSGRNNKSFECVEVCWTDFVLFRL